MASLAVSASLVVYVIIKARHLGGGIPKPESRNMCGASLVGGGFSCRPASPVVHILMKHTLDTGHSQANENRSRRCVSLAGGGVLFCRPEFLVVYIIAKAHIRCGALPRQRIGVCGALLL